MGNTSDIGQYNTLYSTVYRKILAGKSLANELVIAYSKYILGVSVNIGEENFANFFPSQNFPVYSI